MIRSATTIFVAGAIAGIALMALSAHVVNPCSESGAVFFNVEKSLLPCPAPGATPPPVKETRKDASLALAVSSTQLRVGDSFAVTLEMNPSGIPVNAVDAVILYPTSSLRLISKDESLSPFAIRLNDPNDPIELNEVIQIQPSPGVATLAPLATFTFIALQPGTVPIAISSSSSVLANDGFGTDVLGVVSSTSITVMPNTGR